MSGETSGQTYPNICVSLAVGISAAETVDGRWYGLHRSPSPTLTQPNPSHVMHGP